jgi:hypothetical protein
VFQSESNYEEDMLPVMNHKEDKINQSQYNMSNVQYIRSLMECELSSDDDLIDFDLSPDDGGIQRSKTMPGLLHYR